MDDDNADWLSAADEPAPAEAAEPAAAAGGGGGDAEEEGGAGDAEEEDEEEEEAPAKPKRNKSDRTPLFRFWKRPVFLQYSYLYDYRHNYYDDVIDYLDRRQRGLTREIPRPQTWAERALRTYTSKVRDSAAYQRRERDIDLLSDIRTSARFYNYHSREYTTQKYSKYLL